MSPCPACGARGEHVAIIMPWKAAELFAPGRRLLVQHRCPNDKCPQAMWIEAAEDQEALFKRIEAALQPSLRMAPEPKRKEDRSPADIAAILRGGGLTDPDLLLHATAWMVFGRFGVTEDNRREVRDALLLDSSEGALA